MHLYIIRHGQSFANLPEWKSSGIFDVALTDLGHRQSAELGKWVEQNLPIPDLLYTSTLKRARETAYYLTAHLGITPIYDHRIREAGNNYFDHTPIDYTQEKSYTGYWASQQPFSSIITDINGETMLHFRARVGLFLQEMIDKHKGQKVMVVCHGFVIEALIDLVFNVGAYRHCEVWCDNTGISHLELLENPHYEKWRLHFLNRCEHLIALSEKE